MKKTNKKRDELPPTYAVMYGAAAGYAVSPLDSTESCNEVMWTERLRDAPFYLALGSHLPYRRREVSAPNRRIRRCRSQIQLNAGLCEEGVGTGGPKRLHSGTGPNTHPVRPLSYLFSFLCV